MICLHFAPIDNTFSSVVELFEIIRRQKTNEKKEKFASANTEVSGSVQALINRMERLLKEIVMCADYPEFVARFYDVIYKKVRTGTDHDYYMKKIFESDGPVLEVGVGTGRFFLEALEKGADIYGIDISGNMIERLKEKLDKRYHSRVFIQDVVNMSLEKEFNLIIAPFRVFSHIIEVKEQIAALNRIYEHLKDNGKLIFDLYIPNLKLLSEGMKNHTDFEGEYEPGMRVRRTCSVRSDLVKQISYVSMKFVWEEDDKEVTGEWNFPLRFYFRYELEHLIHQSKLKLMNIFGDFNENELSSDSKEFIVVCQKSKTGDL